jgi:hypothetical protein
VRSTRLGQCSRMTLTPWGPGWLLPSTKSVFSGSHCDDRPAHRHDNQYGSGDSGQGEKEGRRDDCECVPEVEAKAPGLTFPSSWITSERLAGSPGGASEQVRAVTNEDADGDSDCGSDRVPVDCHLDSAPSERNAARREDETDQSEYSGHRKDISRLRRQCLDRRETGRSAGPVFRNDPRVRGSPTCSPAARWHHANGSHRREASCRASRSSRLR